MSSAPRSYALVAAALGVVAAAVLFVTGLAPTSADAGSPGFVESFDGRSPAQPLAFRSENWDVTVHHRDREWWYLAEPMDGAHGPNCEGPPATHPIKTYEDSVYNCHDHLMTAINASEYGLIYLTPDHMVDFSAGEAVIRWDMSTFRTSGRDWVDLWITPWGDQLVAPLDSSLPDLNGRPRNSVQVRMENFFPQGGWWTSFKLVVVRDGQAESYSHSVTGYEAFLTPDEKRRDTFELRISRDRVSFGMPDYGFQWFDADISPLAWDRGIVQWGQHSYTPWKDGGGGPNSYHWDNFSISPSVPFSIFASDRRFVDETSPTRTFHLAAPAPAESNLRFMGIGTLEVSFDGGASWHTPRQQSMEKAAPEHFRSYWTRIPEGTTSVTFRGGPDSYYRHWHVRNVAVFSKAHGWGVAPDQR